MASANLSSSEDELIAEINVTPLVDVALVLVIIFMVVAPFLSQILKPLTLPNASRTAMSEQNTIKVSLFPDNTMAVGAQLVPINELAQKIKDEMANGKPPWVILRAGAEIPHGDVMRIMKIIKETGAQRVAFAANPGGRQVEQVKNENHAITR